jgi:acetolactate synthase-1/2/3 large subunit
MWAAQHFHFDEAQQVADVGRARHDGLWLPAAIGAQLGNPNALVIDIAGDASIQMNIQELGTATQYRLPVKIFILNNEYMGMVRQWQELTYESRYSESYSDSLPDFREAGRGLWLEGHPHRGCSQLDAGIAAMLAMTAR